MTTQDIFKIIEEKTIELANIYNYKECIFSQDLIKLCANVKFINSPLYEDFYATFPISNYEFNLLKSEQIINGKLKKELMPITDKEIKNDVQKLLDPYEQIIHQQEVITRLEKENKFLKERLEHSEYERFYGKTNTKE